MINGIEIVLAVLVIVALIIVSVLFVKNGKDKKSTIEKSKNVALNVEKSTIVNDVPTKEENNEPVDDEMAAAFLALHLYMNETLHDEESNVLTIQRIQRRYSPWSSKIYSTNNYPRK